GPGAVYGAVVELDALADADGAGAQHHDDGLAAAGESPALAGAKGAGVEVGRLRRKLRRAGIDHLIARVVLGQVGCAADAADGRVRIAELFALRVQGRRHGLI